MSGVSERSSRMIWVLLVAGPVIWFTHFMAVYSLAEAVCAMSPSDQRLLGLQLVSLATLIATALAVFATALYGWFAYRYWRARRSAGFDWLDGDDLNPGLALAGCLLSALFVVAVLFVGVPAAVLDPC